jgi:hypothetical protein
MANPPPPYDNITGISRAVMKDNAQETLANYNGNARPGELVVNLTTDPPALYIGNSVGQLTSINLGSSFQLAVYANSTVRDSTITSPQPGMMIYVTGTGMQVRGATQWNTITGSGT